METKTIPLSELKEKTRAKIISLEGGHGFQRKLRVMGISEGQTITINSKQPFKGPITITVRGSQLTLGRGMAHKILVETKK